MAKQQTDDELSLKRKARRRLIGAIALTLAVVVLLPMVLDREPGLTGKDIDLSIPSPDRVGEFVPGVAVSEVPATSTPAVSGVVSTQAPNPVIAEPARVAEGKKPHPVPIQHALPGKVPSHNPPDTARHAQPVGAQQPGEAYVAQVGAYTNAVAAKQVRNKLKNWGFKAYTEKSGDKVRVRVGPYPDRDKAEKAGKLLEKHGLHPVILSAK
jgi:DedD protein